jgi:hypothetical protein
VSLPLDADPLVVDAGLVLLVLDEAVLAMRLVPLVVLNMVPNNRNQLSYIYCLHIPGENRRTRTGILDSDDTYQIGI